jgi:hypothetical protein
LDVAGQTASFVDDLQFDPTVTGEANLRTGTAGMSHYVGEAFLRDAEQSDFGFGSEALPLSFDIDVESDAATLGEAFRLDLECGGEAELIEHGRMQDVRKGT